MTKTIKHNFLIAAPPEKVAAALTSEGGIKGWWTTDCTVNGDKGEFHWHGYGWHVHLTIEQNASSVTWRCTQSNMQNTDAWEGSAITFRLYPEGTGTRLALFHDGYKDSPCFEACNQGWAHFVGGSLKAYLETGQGLPYNPATWQH